MKKNIIIYGLVAGAIVTLWMFAGMAGLLRGSLAQGSLLLGYTTMLVAFSMIFVAVKNYRDKHNNGTISFGKAFKIGLLITLIASTIYVLVWLIDFNYFVPNYFVKYSARMLANMKAGGASAAEIKTEAASLQHYGELYKNPMYNAMFTYMEILPVGLVVSLICALILKRKPAADRVMAAG